MRQANVACFLKASWESLRGFLWGRGEYRFPSRRPLDYSPFYRILEVRTVGVSRGKGVPSVQWPSQCPWSSADFLMLCGKWHHQSLEGDYRRGERRRASLCPCEPIKPPLTLSRCVFPTFSGIHLWLETLKRTLLFRVSILFGAKSGISSATKDSEPRVREIVISWRV